MTRPPIAPDFDAYLDDCRARIAAYGHMVQVVGGEPRVPSWAYTIGLCAQGRAELVVFGLPPPVASQVLNGVAARKVLDSSAYVDGIVTVPVRLRPAHANAALPHLPVWRALYPNAALDVQIVQWPDTRGHFPDHAQYTHPLTQTFADLTPTTRH